jgi:hypothetical protein
MIVALTGMDGNRDVSDLAEELALLRVAAGNRVLLVCPDPGAYDPQLYDDLVIDASPLAKSAKADAALARAGVIVALLRREELERPNHAALLERLRDARRANPGARVLVTVAHGSVPLSAHQTGCLLVFVAQLPGARLADMLILDEQGAYHTHHSELEPAMYKCANVLCAPEVRHLYGEVFRPGSL